MMRVVVFGSAPLAATAVARLVAAAVRRRPRLVIGLPTGRTMIPMYGALVAAHRRGRLDFRRISTFNLDEFAGLCPDAPGSYRAFMHQHFFEPVKLRRQATHLPGEDGQAPEAYDRLIAAAGGLDVCVVGIGANGHLGFNEPAARLAAGTHRVKLLPATRRANAYLFGGRAGAVPTHAVSMGMGTILGARLVVLLATGTEKAAIVKRALTGPITTRVPASFLQVHPRAVVVLDRAAARHLTVG